MLSKTYPSTICVPHRNGIRQNTRDMRVKERMQSRRQELVEEMIKRDPLYRPPADYRCGGLRICRGAAALMLGHHMPCFQPSRCIAVLPYTCAVLSRERGRW